MIVESAHARAVRQEMDRQLAEEKERERVRIAKLIAERMMDDRALIFGNLLKGVSAQELARTFHRTENEVQQIFNFILRKIRSRRLERMEPAIPGNTLEELRRPAMRGSRIAFLEILPKLNLDKDPTFKRIMHEEIEMKNDGSMRNEDVLRQLKPVTAAKPNNLKGKPDVRQ